MHKARTITTLALVISLTVAACGFGGDDESAAPAADYDSYSTTTIPTGLPGSAEEPNATDGTSGRSETFGSGGVAPVVAKTVNIGRDIIFRAELTVAVTDLARAGLEATAIIDSLGGFVFGQQTSGGPGGYSVLVFKVLPEDFQEALSRLGSIGEVRTQTISADDVTDRIVDLESRINTAEASVERLRALLAEAGDIMTIAQLENQLLERETQLETLRGQLRTLEDQVALATITLTLTEAEARPGLAVSVSAYPDTGDDGQSCPGESGGIGITEGDDFTLCVTIFNAGDTQLADLSISDTVLDVELTDFTVAWGELSPVLEPGQEVILSLELTAERDIRTRTRVSATPLDADGQPLRSGAVSTVEQFVLDAVDPGGLPGFGDGLAGSLAVLASIGGIIVLGAGAALPLIWLAPLIWLGIRRLRRREEEASLASHGETGPAVI